MKKDRYPLYFEEMKEFLIRSNIYNSIELLGERLMFEFAVNKEYYKVIIGAIDGSSTRIFVHVFDKEETLYIYEHKLIKEDYSVMDMLVLESKLIDLNPDIRDLFNTEHLKAMDFARKLAAK